MSEKTTKEGEQTESVDSQSQNQSQAGGTGENKSIDDKESTSAHQLQTPIAFNVIAAPKTFISLSIVIALGAAKLAMANTNPQVKGSSKPTTQNGSQSRIIVNTNKKPKETSGVIVAPKVAPPGMKLDSKGKSRKVL